MMDPRHSNFYSDLNTDDQQRRQPTIFKATTIATGRPFEVWLRYAIQLGARGVPSPHVSDGTLVQAEH